MIKYNPQLTAVTSLRCMPILAMVSCMHCLLFLLDRKVDVMKILLTIFRWRSWCLSFTYVRQRFWELWLVGGVSLVIALMRKGPIADS